MTVGNTFGWDTVYGIRFSDANAAINNDYRGPPGFSHPAEDGSGITISGDFKPWQMTGGSGHLLIMEITGDELHIDNYPGQPSRVTKTNPIYRVEVELELIPRPLPESANPDDGEPVDLMLKLPNRPGAPEMTAQTNVISVTWDGTVDSTMADVVKLLLTEWFNKPGTLEQFNSIFATVNLNQRISTADEDGHFDWLSPTSVAYGISSVGDGPTSEGILALMCMTEGRDVEKEGDGSELGHTVWPDLVPDTTDERPNVNSGFLISKERFLSNMLRPGLGQMFANGSDKEDEDWPAENFELSGNGTRLENTSTLEIQDLNIAPDDKPEELVTATVSAGGVQLTMSDTDLEIRFQNLTHPYGKTLGKFTLDATHQIKVKCSAGTNNGKFILVPPSEEDADAGFVSHDVAVSKNDLGDAIDWAVIGLDIVGVLLIGGGAVYRSAKGVSTLKATHKVVTGSSNLKNSTLIVHTASKLGGPGQAARGVVQTLNLTKGLTPGMIAFQKFVDVYGVVMLAMTMVLLGKDALDASASEDDLKANTIPAAGDFAARVMKPVTWPGAGIMENIQADFNGGLHITGETKFT